MKLIVSVQVHAYVSFRRDCAGGFGAQCTRDQPCLPCDIASLQVFYFMLILNDCALYHPSPHVPAVEQDVLLSLQELRDRLQSESHKTTSEFKTNFLFYSLTCRAIVALFLKLVLIA